MRVSDLMQAMSEAGAPMEAILIAVRALEERDAVIEAKRAVERDRKRRQRANGQDIDGTVTGQSRDNAGTVTGHPPSSPPPLPSPTPPTNTPTPTPPDNKTTRARKGHRLPIDWQPASLTGDIGLAVAKWPGGAMKRELDRFRDWAASATGPNAVKSDWQAAWRNWLRKAEDEGRYPHTGQRPTIAAGNGAGNGGSYLDHCVAKSAQAALPAPRERPAMTDVGL